MAGKSTRASLPIPPNRPGGGPLRQPRSNLLRHRDATPAVAKPALLGHNGGPPLDEDDAATLGWRGWNWRRAHQRAWRTPPREIALRRLERAEALGMTYRAYTLELLERGRHL